jgi:ferredoxin
VVKRKDLAMAKYRVDVAAERCSGCLRCELGCSDAHTKSFNPSMARIQVTMTERDCQVLFTEECVSCGICADQCFYGALSKTQQEEDNQ